MAKAKPKSEETDADPATVVRGFIAAMHEWELAAADAFARANRARENWFDEEYGIQAGMDAVFARYCTPKKRPYGRNASFGMPPEYQPEHEAILEVAIESPRRAAVDTQRSTGFGHRRMYILAKRGGLWLLDSVKWRQHDGTWSNGIL